jgi:acyl-CoA synthetase (AMP-forming)/AMP-acid ligase II
VPKDSEKIERSIHALVRSGAELYGNKAAVIFNGLQMSYAELDERSDKLASRLVERGINIGDRVALLQGNSPQFLIAAAATSKAGATLLPLNFRMTAPELGWIIADAQPRLIIAEDVFAETAIAAAAVSGIDSEVTTIANADIEDTPLPQGHCPGNAADALLLYTSGTTGRPKGVRITDSNIAAVWSLAREVPGFDYEETDVVLATMPQFHIAGINSCLIALDRGATLVLAHHSGAETAVDLVAEYGCTRAFLVPAMIGRMGDELERRGAELTTLKEIAYGGSPITGALLDRARRLFGCSFAQLYGLTETTGAGTCLSMEEHFRKAGSCGRAWPGLSIQAVSEDSRPSAPDAQGELAISGPTLMAGYWRNEAATAETLVDGAVRTGDGGFVDEDGFVFIVDRIKDLIITGGENVSPTEVESVISFCPGVRDVAVVGLPSERWGEEVTAVVVVDEGHDLTDSDIMQWARARIAGYKAPKSVRFAESLPRNASGKILRRELRERFGD